MAEQLRHFLSIIYKEGESYELVTKSGVNDKGKFYPLRSKQNIRSFGSEDITVLEQLIQNTPDGAWITSNPIRAEVQGNAASDKDIADYRFVLIESDDISREGQWKQLQELHLPIATVVWSGGKSLHALVRIDAGTDRKLYDNRVRSLYKYLEDKQFKADTANKNPSKLTRVPGFYRGNDMQYLVAENLGPKSWLEFENTVLAPMYKKDMRSITSKINGQQGGRPQIQVTEIAAAYLDEHKNKAGETLLHYYNGSWWTYADRCWNETTEDDLKIQVAGFMQRQNIQALGRIGNAAINDTLANLKSDEMAGLPSLKYHMSCWLPEGSSAQHFMTFTNGILDVEALVNHPLDATLLPCTPTLFSSKKVNYAYDPDAQCPLFMEYLNTTFDSEEMREVVIMMLGYIIFGGTEFNVGFFLIGPGGDGKSALVFLLPLLIGENDTCCLSFSEMGDKFSSHLLTKNKLNLVEELETGDDGRSMSKAEKIFKMVTDGGVITTEEKFKGVSKANAIARCVFCTNELPAFTDRSNGLWDRLVIIPFTHRFRGTAAEKKGLKHTIAAQELPGIFNLAVEGARKLKDLTRFPLPEESLTAIRSHRISCDHEQEFLTTVTEAAENGVIPKGFLYQQYRLWAEESGYHPVALAKFQAAVKRMYPDVEEIRIRNPSDHICWKGIQPRKTEQ